MTLARTIRRARLSSGLTLAQLAARVGCSLPWVSDIEHGRKRPSEELTAKLAEALGRSSNAFLTMLLQERLERAGFSLRVTLETMT